MRKKEVDVPRVAQFVEMCDFPCNKEDLLLTADECQFPDDVMNVCEDLPNKTYESEQEVIEAVEIVVGSAEPDKTKGTTRRFA